MQVTIIKEDNFVLIDGVQKEMDLSFLPDDFHALQFDGSEGSVESNDIDKCVSLKNVTDWSLWSDFEAKAKAAKKAITADDLAEEPVQDVMEDEVVEEEEEFSPPTEEEVMLIWRELRNNLLAESDIPVLRKLERGETVEQALIDYRQALRDLPQKVESGSIPKPIYKDNEVIFNNWPTKPF